MKKIFIRLLWVFCFLFSSVSSGAVQNPRIVALSPHIVEMLFELGVGEKIIATTERSDYPEAAKKIPIIGNYSRIKVEKVIALKPDIIFAWKNGNPENDLKRLASYDVKVVYSHPIKLDDVATELEQFAKILKVEAKGKRLARQYREQLQLIRKRYSTALPVSVFYEVWNNPLTSVANEAWPQQILEVCGAENILSNIVGNYPQVTRESVIEKMPQVIILPFSKNGPSSKKNEWKKWRLIPAIKNQWVFYPDADRIHRMTSRSLREIESLCENINSSREFYYSSVKK